METKTDDNNKLVKADVPYSERFTNAVIKEFSSNNGEIQITPFQKKLCQNYFIKIDMILKDLERKRLAKSEQYRDALPITWENVNLQKLANDVITYSAVGLDPTQPNHISPVPFKNTSSNKLDITFIMGYRGIELKAKKYGFEIPDDVVVELVYSTDTFKQFKKDINNKIENYEFKINNDFNRGELQGGFYYHSYFDKPQKNKLRVFTKADIDKRKPDYASAEFWGGEKVKWVNGQKQGTETVEGWYEEMALKTIHRAAYNNIAIDSEKIDATYLTFVAKENQRHDLKIMQKIEDEGNKETTDFEEVENPNPAITNGAGQSAVSDTPAATEDNNDGGENLTNSSEVDFEQPANAGEKTNEPANKKIPF